MIIGSDNKHFRACINDSNVRLPLDDTTHREEDVRVCFICDNTRILLGDWPNHIRGYYHQIKYAIQKKLHGCCFLTDKHIRPHLWNQCDVCLERREDLRQKPELLDSSLNDMSVYNPLIDQSYVEYLDRVAAAERTTSGFSCEACGKLNLLKEYFDKHIAGKFHKLNMKQTGTQKHRGSLCQTSVSNKRKADSSDKNTSCSKKSRFTDKIPDNTWNVSVDDSADIVADETSNVSTIGRL